MAENVPSSINCILSLCIQFPCQGLPSDGDVQFADSYKHMSAIVVLNSMELLVDLMRYPGQLIPCSTKAIFMTHISAAGESDSAENDSCDSPLEPNSPLYGYSEKADPERYAFAGWVGVSVPKFKLVLRKWHASCWW